MSNTSKTFGFRQKMRIGAQIANQLPKLCTARAAAKQLGISTTALRRAECLALYKVAMRLVNGPTTLIPLPPFRTLSGALVIKAARTQYITEPSPEPEHTR